MTVILKTRAEKRLSQDNRDILRNRLDLWVQVFEDLTGLFA